MDGNRLRELARQVARHRRHAEVEPLHVLHALVNSPLESPLLAEAGLRQPALRLACEAHLAWLAVVGSYRDGMQPPISAAVEQLLSENSGIAARILARPSGSLAPVVERLLADPAIAAIILSDRSAAMSIATIVTRATALATTRGDRIVRPEHALAVVTREPFFRGALGKLDADAIRIDGAVEQRLADLDKGSGRPPTRLSKELSAVVDYARFVAKNAEPALLPPVATVVRLLAEPNVVALLGQGGVDATDVAYVLVHGEVALDQAADAPELT